jgi:FG-GAP-like repeat/FG-GAP repeat
MSRQIAQPSGHYELAPDEALALNSGSGNVSILLGNGDGTFMTAVNFDLHPFAQPQSVATGDFNGDGRPDLAVSDTGGSTVSVLLGNGDGTFQPAVNVPVNASTVCVAVGDFNGDGKLDLVVFRYNQNTFSVVLGKGNGTFQTAVNYGTQRLCLAVAVGDVNGDGKPDLAVADHGGVSVFLGKGDGTFQTAVHYDAGSPGDFASVAVGDLNNDSKADLVVANQLSQTVSVLLGKGDGTFQAAVNFGAGPQPIGVAVGDFNSDGQRDLAVVNYNSASISVLLNTCGSSGARLSLVRSNSTTTTISWPLLTTRLVLESTTNLSLTNWQSTAETVATNNGRLEVSVNLDQAQRFFRLRTP